MPSKDLLPADFPPPEMADAEKFGERIQAIYGDATGALLAAMRVDEQLPIFWLNTLRHGRLPEGSTALDGLTGMYTHADWQTITHSSAATEGEIYIQNPSSYLAVQVLGPRPEEEVLDLAAAPGGKTIAMAAAMGNSGRIAAVEPVPGRFHRLRANLARCGVTNVDLYKKDGRGVGRLVPERFDRVLLDAPCSSEARMRWSQPESYRRWSLRKVKETSRKQKSLIRSAYTALKPGGEMIYCTCSLSPEENELVVQQLLRKTAAQLLPITLPDAQTLKWRVGLTQWLGKDLTKELSQTIRILPGRVWDGFYLARIYKPENTDD